MKSGRDCRSSDGSKLDWRREPADFILLPRPMVLDGWCILILAGIATLPCFAIQGLAFAGELPFISRIYTAEAAHAHCPLQLRHPRRHPSTDSPLARVAAAGACS